MGLSCFKSWKHDSTGRKGNRDVLASPGSYFFLSNSAGQGDEWLKSLNKGVWIPFTGVFGQRLEETVLYERRYGLRLVPLVVEQCVNFIRERGLQEVGLFRQPGQASLVKELQEAFDAGERPSLDSSTDVHTVASLLKLYLRQLPEPLVPYGCYQDFLLCGQTLKSDHTQGLGELRSLLHDLPVANFNLLNFICQFLNEVQSFSGSNKMSDQNLATVFGPNILRGKAEDPQSIMGGAALVQVLMLELIREHESLFAKVSPPLSSYTPEGSHASPSALRHPRLRQLSMPLIAGQSTSDAQNHSCIYGAAAHPDSSWAQKRLLGHRYTSSHPENCFYPLPSSSQPPQHQPDRPVYHQDHAGEGSFSSNVQASATSLQLQAPLPDSSKPRLVLVDWTKPWPGPAEADFWSSGAADREGAVQDAASGGSSEAQEDSTTSAYDNLDRVSSHQRLEDVTGEHLETNDPGDAVGTCEEKEEPEEAGQRRDSSSCSSCEVLPLDESTGAVEAVNTDISPKKPESLSPNQAAEEENSDHGDHEDINNNNDEDNDDNDDESVHHLNSPASALSVSLISTGSSEVFLPSGPPYVQGPVDPPQPWEAHSALGKLQQQMAQQKAEYQARIQRLARCNDVLERQVAVLRVSLQQQKRSQSVTEIKIRNVERAKADADRRNNTMQREMEQFFQMYGESRRRGGGEEGRGGGSL
ncbi:rho GTPase-activating protein 24-like isoform X2 [Hippoglossus hippoglossus]|uniref:rho GTPase-activating protein 24-like isoform X2 n=1 Tax=Hippoglossus hippoglossus TaxID=8267 RepID=UPI00148C03ED|nr:rho GTPase-activating protein 24-like isoform X2 [Hippoglossus hippoglossus]